uniref:Uncharacterized protein n=1 Tax=Anguilla anguilla TaxID=7936 RepID=A0A0E9S7Q1_ANGAN
MSFIAHKTWAQKHAQNLKLCFFKTPDSKLTLLSKLTGSPSAHDCLPVTLI